MVSFLLIFQLITVFDQSFLCQEDTAQIIHIEAVTMSYSIKQFTVKSSLPVEIHFTNRDVIRHNILIIEPGSLEMVGRMADEMATSPDGIKKEWVPEIPEVLFHTPLISKGDKYILKFIAPAKKGKYPFVCTFPTHWRMMNGEMIVENVL